MSKWWELYKDPPPKPKPAPDKVGNLQCGVWPWSLNARQLALHLFLNNDIDLDEAAWAAKEILEEKRD